jgi:hypothetical protein
MIDILKKLGAGGGVGFLIGLMAVAWIKPDTGPGVTLLIVICIIVCGLIGGLLGWLFGLSKSPKGSDEKSTGLQKSGAPGDDEENSG